MAEVKLYNAGDRLKESIKYTTRNSKEDFKQYNWIAHYPVDAPAQDWFTLPDEIRTPATANMPAARVPVNFPYDMAHKHGHKGIVAVIPERATPYDDDEPFAATEEEAKEKAERLWMQHLRKTVEDHVMACAAARAGGAAPYAASHFTRRAFKLLQQMGVSIQDPGEMIFKTVQEESAQPKSDDKGRLEAELAESRKQAAEALRQNSLLQKKLDAQAKAAKELAEAEKQLSK
jgi:hypothetical protein